MQKMSFYLEFSSSIMDPFESVFYPVCICMVCVNLPKQTLGSSCSMTLMHIALGLTQDLPSHFGY